MPQQKRRSEPRYRPVRVPAAYDPPLDRSEEPHRHTEPAVRLGPYEFRYPVELGYAVQNRISME